PSLANKAVLERVEKTNAVSLHIRRGDYVTVAHTNQLHGTCSIDYYQRAAELIADVSPDPVFYIFSDDIAWVRENLQLPFPIVFVEGNDEAHAYEDMRLMSRCRHHILANSSFSWWGAWLNGRPDKIVVAPQKWMNNDSIVPKDLIPVSWKRL
ncbi:MAG: alpha-1,2-fucosyltransferase, partial [Bacteroidetes bacterium]|nr:alpha-1,2-fucosyltransferase [Bacteroidota bacterium]